MNKNLKLKRIIGIGAKVILIAFVLLVGNNTVFGATDEPLQVINNLKDFIKNCIK